jgi:hypothetical protein
VNLIPQVHVTAKEALCGLKALCAQSAYHAQVTVVMAVAIVPLSPPRELSDLGVIAVPSEWNSRPNSTAYPTTHTCIHADYPHRLLCPL